MPGWRSDDTKLVASIRWHRSFPIFYFFAVAWNLGLPLVVPGSPPMFKIIGYLAAVAFAVLGVRSLASRTTMRFDARAFVVETPLAFWQRTEILIADIERFETITRSTTATELVARLKNSATIDLPIDWQPLPVVIRGIKTEHIVAKREAAQWLGTMLNEMLSAARLLGHDTYRS